MEIQNACFSWGGCNGKRIKNSFYLQWSFLDLFWLLLFKALPLKKYYTISTKMSVSFLTELGCLRSMRFGGWVSNALRVLPGRSNFKTEVPANGTGPCSAPVFIPNQEYLSILNVLRVNNVGIFLHRKLNFDCFLSSSWLRNALIDMLTWKYPQKSYLCDWIQPFCLFIARSKQPRPLFMWLTDSQVYVASACYWNGTKRHIAF